MNFKKHVAHKLSKPLTWNHKRWNSKRDLLAHFKMDSYTSLDRAIKLGIEWKGFIPRMVK
tara:strand:+ start:9234 stop:9413 length:180 start_codon:yes stop_codon:yes gene_type:complete